MGKLTKADILRRVEEEDIEFIRLQFTDVYGQLKNVAITRNQLENALDNHCVFDGSAVEGFTRVEESDMYLYPDLDTFAVFPWRPQQGRVARLICDVYKPDRTPYEGDPRYILKKQIDRAQKSGFLFEVGPECEFFLFDEDENGYPLIEQGDKAGYFDLGPNDSGENTRRDIVMAMEEMGYGIEASHHETAPSQHEVDLRYGDALHIADAIMTFKLVTKTMAERHGKFASFMPQPRSGISGSGMHINMNLRAGDTNCFADEQDVLGLSETAYHFMGGILAHAPGLSLITNPIVNSYKRLVKGYEAPTDILWAAKNRNAFIRVPVAEPVHRRIELRSPDSACNPYLALAGCLGAGLDGVENAVQPAPVGTRSGALPRDLISAVDAFEQDTLMRTLIGETLSEKFIRDKREEWNTYCVKITDWEVRQYLYKL